jgi:hypothetical protein
MSGELGDKIVSCSFLKIRRGGNELEQVNVRVPTGASPWRIRLRDACQGYAVAESAQVWAMPHLVGAEPGAWLVYEHNSTGVEVAPHFLARMPNRDAAEMWMLHHAE